MNITIDESKIAAGVESAVSAAIGNAASGWEVQNAIKTAVAEEMKGLDMAANLARLAAERVRVLAPVVIADTVERMGPMLATALTEQLIGAFASFVVAGQHPGYLTDEKRQLLVREAVNRLRGSTANIPGDGQ